MTTVVFPGRYESLAAIADFIRQGAEELDLDSCASYAVETAVDEACSNIIEHAYGGENLGNISCSYEVFDNSLIIELRDTGKPFDPSIVPDPDLHASLEDREDHGLGLFFMRQWMDDVRFSVDNGENVLTMVKRKGSKS